MHNNQHPGQKWIRTCQECRVKQDARTPPVDAQSYTRYAEIKCKNCKSIGLDYGKWVPDNKGQAEGRMLPLLIMTKTKTKTKIN